MKIKKLEIGNYLGIEELSLPIDEKGAAIQGGSRKGKTSLLDAIVQTVTNDNPRTKIVRNENEPAKIYVEMDDGHKITRTFNAAGYKTVSIEKDGMRPKGPETYLKGLLGSRVMMIDPTVLLHRPEKEKELAETILSLLPIEVTPEDANKWFREIVPVDYNQHGLKVCKDIENYYYGSRTGVNRELKTLKVEASSIKEKLPKGYAREEWQDINLSERFQKVQDAMNIRQQRKEMQDIISNEKTDIESLQDKHEVALKKYELDANRKKAEILNRIQELEKKIAVFKSELKNIENNHNSIKNEFDAKLEGLIKERKFKTQKAKQFLEDNPVQDIEKLQEEVGHAEKMKAYVPLSEQLENTLELLTEKEKQAAELTAKIEIIRNKPIELLSNINIPIQGLSVDGSGNVLINNLPLSNLSTSEITELLCDIEIAKTSEVKFVCVDRWESLSTELQEIIQRKFTDAGIQLFYTEVTAGELLISDIA